MKHRPAHAVMFGSLLVWPLLIGATALDAALLKIVIDSYGSSTVYWLWRRITGEPLMALLCFDAVALRCGIFLVGARLASVEGQERVGAWLLFVPVFGAPLALAAVASRGAPRPAAQATAATTVERNADEGIPGARQ